MASARGNSNNGHQTVYEQERNEQIAVNNEKLASLGLPVMNMCNEPRKRTKRTHNISVEATRVHNLRPRTQTSHAMNANEQVEEDLAEQDLAEEDLSEDDWECESTGDFLCDNEDFHSNTQGKRNGRGISRLDEVFARKPGMPKIKVMVNEYGQPVGENARRFSSAVGIHVRRKISIACADWRLVDPEIKDAVWADIKEFYDIDDKAFDWFLNAAGKKWKDFKANLKVQFFKGKITEEKIRKKQGERLNDDDWKFLKNHWTSPESEARSEIAKANRSKLSIHHTTGSKSFACNRHELANELGRAPRRDELYIKTHTRKNRIPSRNAEPIINKLKSIIEAQPELTERTIQEGDAFAAACGKKEPKGRVRVLGLGPTPQTVGTPGVKGYTPTRVQMQVLECKRKESHQATLEQRIAELEAELAREKLARERSSMENVSQNGSNSRHHESPRSEENYVETNHVAEFHEDGAYIDNSNEYEYVLMRRTNLAPPFQQPHQSSSSPFVQPNTFPIASFMQPPQSSPIRTTPVVQPPQSSSITTAPVVQPHRCSPIGAAPSSNGDANRMSHADYIGKDVILYALQKEDQPVARGVVISVNPSTVHAGQALGRKHCEVVIKLVIKRDTKLPCPYPGVQEMADAKDLSIAWPYNRVTSNIAWPYNRPYLLADSPAVKATWITRCPLLLLDTRMPKGALNIGCKEHLDPAGTGSFYNEGEADIVTQQVLNLVHCGVSPSAIVVQSPYIAQVQLLREKLEEYPGLSAVEVSTIDSFQGREADAVIISMVRSNPLGAVGFLGDSRRINVAITRARKHVTVVCDTSTICHSTFLARLLRHIRRYGQVKHVAPGSLDGVSGLGFSQPTLPSIS